MDSYDKMGSAGSDGAETPPASPKPDEGSKNVVMLSADHFPKDMTPKDGDKLTFCVTGAPDSEGNVSGYFEPMGGASADADDGGEADFRKEMSPTKPQDEPA